MELNAAVFLLAQRRVFRLDFGVTIGPEAGAGSALFLLYIFTQSH
jgi:hypothetical protein